MSSMIRPRLAAESLTASTFMFVLVVISSLQEGRWTHVSRYYWLRCVVCRAGWRPAHSTARASAAGDVLPALGVLLLHVVRTLAEGGLQVVEDLHVRTQVGLEVVAQLVVGVGRGTGPVAHDRLDLLLLLVGLVRDLRGLLGHHVDGLVDGGVVVCDHRCSLLLRMSSGVVRSGAEEGAGLQRDVHDLLVEVLVGALLVVRLAPDVLRHGLHVRDDRLLDVLDPGVGRGAQRARRGAGARLQDVVHVGLQLRELADDGLTGGVVVVRLLADLVRVELSCVRHEISLFPFLPVSPGSPENSPATTQTLVSEPAGESGFASGGTNKRDSPHESVTPPGRSARPGCSAPARTAATRASRRTSPRRTARSTPAPPPRTRPRAGTSSPSR